MARRSSQTTVNKSDEIRRYVAQNPSAGPKQIREDLGREGIRVTASLVNRIKYGGGVKKKRRGRKAKVATATNGTTPLTVEHLIAAKKLAVQLGSVQSAKQAVDALARLG